MAQKTRAAYPTFDHNARRVAAWNQEGLAIGAAAYLIYVVDGRGTGCYQVTSDKLEKEIRYNNSITTPVGACTIVSRYSEYVVWCDRIPQGTIPTS